MKSEDGGQTHTHLSLLPRQCLVRGKAALRKRSTTCWQLLDKLFVVVKFETLTFEPCRGWKVHVHFSLFPLSIRGDLSDFNTEGGLFNGFEIQIIGDQP